MPQLKSQRDSLGTQYIIIFIITSCILNEILMDSFLNATVSCALLPTINNESMCNRFGIFFPHQVWITIVPTLIEQIQHYNHAV